VRRPSARGGRPQAPQSVSPIAQAFPIVRRALKILADREVSPQTGLLKSTLLQLDSTFSERTYGASSFLDFVEKLAKEGIVTLKHAGRSVMVELNDGFGEGASVEAVVDQPPDNAGGRPTQLPPAPPMASPAEGVARASQILAAARNARWPMYLRNVKQILRQSREPGADSGFDERRYGFGGLMDLLKALQRDTFVRIERDRRGGLRVFQGSALQRLAVSSPMDGLPLVDPALEAVGEEPVDVAPTEPIEAAAAEVVEQPEAEPMPVDTTAELLGRAKVRKPRSARVPRLGTTAAPKRAAAKKPARRSTRSRKGPAADANDETQS